ncbi:LysR family transcriptional regulator [Woodsholea maritima]|uniref:LysR family transcriptional regulator n=1 Tax=Woodsholea maritima TaxID=240237 RepID=UPI000362863A|nr:LysR family transcriptional regulator [Woodsholea maritima]
MAAWDGIAEFLCVVETGGFTAAAKRLGVSTSHVSRQVAQLEDRLGVKLLARSTRLVRVTEAGEIYFARMSDIASAMADADQVVAGLEAHLRGKIRVSAGGAMAEYYVAPALAQFAAQNPGVEIELDFNARNVNLIDEGFDFAIRYGVLAENGLIARKLCTRDMVCAAAPAYLARAGMPRHPDELKHHACLRTNQAVWTFQDIETQVPIDVRVKGPWITNNASALCTGAMAGLGVVYTPRESLREALAAGALTPILEGYEDKTRSSWIVYPERRHMPLRVRRAIDHVFDTVKAAKAMKKAAEASPAA